jgi:hypothetical protein
MKNKLAKTVLMAALALVASAQANAKSHSKSIVVESPSDLPEVAQRHSEAMYLFQAGSGQTVLYLEEDQGRTLAILDVTEPGAIRTVAQVSITTTSPYDFIGPLNHPAVLIQYRDHSGFAIIDLKKFNKPALTDAPQFRHASEAQALGPDGLLLTSGTHPDTQSEDAVYQVFDTANASNPSLLATIEGVKQHLERPQTGTIFVLSATGLTVIRRPAVEQSYRTESEAALID